MSFVIKNKDSYLKFDRFVRDMDIITVAEPVVSHESATTFSSTAAARLVIKELDKVGYDTTDYTIHDKEQLIKEAEEKAKQLSAEYMREAWKNTSEKRKREMLGEILAKHGSEGVTKWLADVNDTSSITPETTEERFQKKIEEIESSLGIKLTDEQIENLKAKEGE